jgi:SAM-dependent methyltransferase
MLMKTILLEVLRCPSCGGAYREEAGRLICRRACAPVLLQDGIPLFSPVPADLLPTEKRQRGAAFDTPWRAANEHFLRSVAGEVAADALVMDVGAGRGEFAALFDRQRYLAVDIYPYPEVDLVCDLTAIHPFAPGCADLLLLANMLEHVAAAADFLKAVAPILRPGGFLLATVPFLVEIHQAPHDFARYTHYLLEKMGAEAGLVVERMEGYYDPAFLMGESYRYTFFWALPRYPLARRRILAAALAGLRLYQRLLGRLLGPGYVADPRLENNPAPVGYQILYRKAG